MDDTTLDDLVTGLEHADAADAAGIADAIADALNALLADEPGDGDPAQA